MFVIWLHYHHYSIYCSILVKSFFKHFLCWCIWFDHYCVISALFVEWYILIMFFCIVFVCLCPLTLETVDLIHTSEKYDWTARCMIKCFTLFDHDDFFLETLVLFDQINRATKNTILRDQKNIMLFMDNINKILPKNFLFLRFDHLIITHSFLKKFILIFLNFLLNRFKNISSSIKFKHINSFLSNRMELNILKFVIIFKFF